MIRIVYVMDAFDLPLGGTERQFLALLERLDRAKFEPHLALLRVQGAENALLFPCPTTILGLYSLLGWSAVRATRTFQGLHRRQGFDIAHLCFNDASRIGPLWARGCRIPVTVGTRRNLGYKHKTVDRVLLRALSPLITHTVANSAAAAEETMRTEGVPASRISVIANGLDHQRFRPISPDARSAIRARWGVPEHARVVGSVANLRPIKNPMFLVKSASQFVARFPDLHVVLLGEGSLRADLEARIAALGLERHVHLPGVSENPAEDIQAFDIGVLCSDSESSPNAVIEYLAAGRPAVASHVGGAAEIITHDVTGFLYPRGDEHSFANYVSTLLDDPGLRARMGDAGRIDAISRFSMDRMVREHEALYARLQQQARA